MISDSTIAEMKALAEYDELKRNELPNAIETTLKTLHDLNVILAQKIISSDYSRDYKILLMEVQRHASNLQIALFDLK